MIKRVMLVGVGAAVGWLGHTVLSKGRDAAALRAEETLRNTFNPETIGRSASQAAATALASSARSFAYQLREEVPAWKTLSATLADPTPQSSTPHSFRPQSSTPAQDPGHPSFRGRPPRPPPPPPPNHESSRSTAMKSQDIASRWLDFFAQKDHATVPSASLVSPEPSLLFTIAGMVPFIPYFLGQETPPYQRAASVQKCIRTADIEEVGKTVRHGTFFQMCGNFSFGDYFKEKAIPYAWELLTTHQDQGGYGLDPQRLWVTVYEEDGEAERIWREDVGIPAERIQRLGKEDNYWHTGQPGPGGPDSEIFYDRGPEYGRAGGPSADENRYMEIWNLVFMQYQLSEVNSQTDFTIAGEFDKNIDTGLGLERLAMILQGVETSMRRTRSVPSWTAPQPWPARSTPPRRTPRTRSTRMTCACAWWRTTSARP